MTGDSSPPESRSSVTGALRLTRLIARGFRNLEATDLVPGPRFNVIGGENGQGKSNFLEAVFYLGSLGSFRLARKDDLIGHSDDRALLAGRFERSPAATTAKVSLSRRTARALSLDDKRPRSTAAWTSSLPMVLFHPGDLALASGSPELRRTFLDRVLGLLDVSYAKRLADYTKALRSRNRLLKQEVVDRRSIEAFDVVLSESGAVIGRARAELAAAIKPITERVFAEVAGDALPFAVEYRPRVEPEPDRILAALRRAYSKDRARGFTGDGPHADDLTLRTRERGARHHASQGQHRMMVLALKVAELEIISERSRQIPVLLLDDVSSELDRTRNERLFSVLAAIGGQVFLTTTHPELIRLERDRLDFIVEHGRITPQG